MTNKKCHRFKNLFKKKEKKQHHIFFINQNNANSIYFKLMLQIKNNKKIGNEGN